uniref:hypothetical protein n=1 Tax=Aeromonas caviae TaxID=648 RepID=UPI001C59FE44
QQPTEPQPATEPVKMSEMSTEWNCDMMPTVRMAIVCKVHNDLGEEGRKIVEQAAMGCVLGASGAAALGAVTTAVTGGGGVIVTLPAAAVACAANALAANGINVKGVNDLEPPS